MLHGAGNGRVTGRALVDLDAVRTQKKRAWTDPLGYLMGTAAGHRGRHADDEERRRAVRARVGARSPASPIPKSLLQELLSYYSTHAGEPRGINMDEPFELPAAIKRDQESVRGTAVDRPMNGVADPLQGSLQFLKGVGPRRAADLQRAGLSTVEDLLYRFPTRYEDRGHFQTIASLRPGVVGVGLGEVLSCGIRPTRRPRFKIFEMLLRDQTGSLRASGSTSRSSRTSSIRTSASSSSASSS